MMMKYNKILIQIHLDMRADKQSNGVNLGSHVA